MSKVLPLLLLAILSRATSDDTHHCLASQGATCADTTNCDATGKATYERACLTSSVPFRTPLRTVQCCFKCCLEFWQRELGLAAIYDHWREVQKTTRMPNGALLAKHGLPLPSDVLVSHLTAFYWATRRQVTGRHGVGVESFRGQVFSYGIYNPKLPHDLGTEAVIVTATDAWVKPVAGAKPKRWFGTNPLNVSSMGSAVGRSCRGDLAQQLSLLSGGVSNGTINANSQKRLTWARACLGSTALDDVFPLWRFRSPNPTGRMNGMDLSVLESMAFPRGLSSSIGWEKRFGGGNDPAPLAARDGPLMLCGSCISLHHLRPGIKATLLKNGFCENEFPDSRAGTDHREAFDVCFARYLSAKSVWDPPGNGWATHRTWETLLSGAIPVLAFHPNFLELYDELPVIQVTNWSGLTPTILKREIDHIEADLHSYDSRKLYWPYWLHKLTEHMPVRRAKEEAKN